MRRMIIILSVLFFAASASAEFPIDYQCHSDPDVPLEAELCTRYKVALADSGFITFEYSENKPYFRIIVLPTARDGYISISIASNFLYPPLAGFALSAHLSSYIMLPGGLTDTHLRYMVAQNLRGISMWLVAFDKSAPARMPGNAMEVSNVEDNS